VPASPELIIEHNALLERRESEITSRTKDEVAGEITYTLSLSVKSDRTVNVTVTKQAESTADCATHPDGLLFNTTSYTFEPRSWNVPQTVQIEVRRNIDTFQGTSIARFFHKTTSEDPTWRSAFLRPMTVIIADDDECTDGARKRDNTIHNIRTCGCDVGHFIKTTDASYCGSVTSCVPCPDGTACTGEESLEEMLLLPGKYRISNTSIAVVDCPTPDACTGTLKNLDPDVAQELKETEDKDNAGQLFANALMERLQVENSTDDLSNWGDALCRVGHQGVFCQVCTVEATVAYYWSGQSCEKCEGERGIATCMRY
jgi:hypothetical protein